MQAREADGASCRCERVDPNLFGAEYAQCSLRNYPWSSHLQQQVSLALPASSILVES